MLTVDIHFQHSTSHVFEHHSIITLTNSSQHLYSSHLLFFMNSHSHLSTLEVLSLWEGHAFLLLVSAAQSHRGLQV